MENPNIDLLIDYNRRCLNFDWGYDWSDDPNYTMRKREEKNALWEESKQSMLRGEIYSLNYRYGNHLIGPSEYRINLLGIFGFIPEGC